MVYKGGRRWYNTLVSTNYYTVEGGRSSTEKRLSAMENSRK